MAASDDVNPSGQPFDFDQFPADTLFYERREVWERRGTKPAPDPVAEAPERPRPERRARKERRRRIDPTTFEKQYTDDELEFMNAMQQFKNRSGKSFPSHGDVLRVALGLGYRLAVVEATDGDEARNGDGDESASDLIPPLTAVLPAF